MIYNLFWLLIGGGCILSIFSCQPLHAIGYTFDCPNIVCLILFPNINQTPKQNHPNQLEMISRYPKENEPEVFLNTYSYINLAEAYNVISAYQIIWWPGLQLRGGLRPWKNFLLPWKNVLGTLLYISIVFIHAINVKFGPPSDNSLPPSVPSWLQVCWWLLPCDFCQLCHSAQSFHNQTFHV